MDFLFDIVLDALLDTLKMLPFLFAAYLLMELLEKRPEGRLHRALTEGRAAPVAGSILGLIPQCGFSAAAANLFNRGLLSVGTLLAVFISTSDEAVPMLLASPQSYPLLLRLLLFKLILALACGLILDGVLRMMHKSTHLSDEGCDCHCCPHEEDGTHESILFPALHHTLQIAVFIFGFSLALGALLELMGEATLSRILMTGSLWQPFVAALVGFIPNCASSILLTQLLLDGSLSFGSALAGLTTGAGAGLLVLFRGYRNPKGLFSLLGLLYAIAVLAGLVADLLPVL